MHQRKCDHLQVNIFLYWIYLYLRIHYQLLKYIYWRVTSTFSFLISRPCGFYDIYIYIFDNPGCPGQLTHTMTNFRIHWTSCKPSKQVKHRESDRHARWGLNPGCRSRESLPIPRATSSFYDIIVMLCHGWGVFEGFGSIINCDVMMVAGAF